MADTFIWGKRGAGKTLQAVERIYFKWLEGYEIWGNLWLHPYFNYNPITRTKGNYHNVDAIDLIKLLLNDNLNAGSEQKLLILDEIKTQANARSFTSNINKLLTDFVSQARKRNFAIIYTDQILSSYDKWIRLMTDSLIRCIPHYLSGEMYTTNPKLATDIGWGTREYPEPIYFEYREGNIDQDEREGISDVKIFYRSRQTARMFYPCYKTGQVITPIELKYGGGTE